MNAITLTDSLLQKITAFQELIGKQSELIQAQATKLEEQAVTIKRLQTRIAELEKRTKKNSSNSSKPPSSDGLSKPPRTSSLRERGKNKSGGQLGHKGETLKQALHPDIITRHIVTSCPDCHSELSSEPLTGIVKRQVFDIPPPKIEVTEHQAEVKYCTCCNRKVMAAFPEEVRAPVQYGAVVRAWAVYYQHQHFIPEDRLQQLFSDLYDIHLATATLTQCSQVAFAALAPFEESVLSMVRLAAVKNLDETGFRVAGKTQWLHVASTQNEIPKERLSRLTRLYDNIINEGLLFHEKQIPLPLKGKQGRRPKRTGHNLLVRLLHYKEDVLRFLNDPLVPFTNNDAERDLRMAKCKQKIS